MSTAITCQKCGHENQLDWRFCSQCGKSKKMPTAARDFPEVLDIHLDADLSAILGELLPYESDLLDEWAPSINQFRDLCEQELTLNQRQCLYRRYQLHLAGPQPVRAWASIARERGGSGGAVKSAVEMALRHLHHEVYRMVYSKVSDLRDQRFLAGI